MRQENPAFLKPIDENIQIWHYMSFAEYASLLDRTALFFTRVDRLEDKFEGSLPKHTFDPLFEGQFTEEQYDNLEINKGRILAYSDFMKRATVVNCWHISNHESDAMWKDKEGVAIQSTYKRLSDRFNNYQEYDWDIGVVNYIDHDTAKISWNNMYLPIVHKNIGFDYEKELRVVLSKNFEKELTKVTDKKQNGVEFLEFPIDGIEAKIDLEALVEKVVASPRTGKWFEELVRSLTKKYEFDKPVVKSSLAR